MGGKYMMAHGTQWRKRDVLIGSWPVGLLFFLLLYPMHGYSLLCILCAVKCKGFDVID